MPYKDPIRQKQAVYELVRKHRMLQKIEAEAKRGFPSGFKSKEEYNEYMKHYLRHYREKKRETRKLEQTQTVNRLQFLESEVQRLNRCLEIALNK